MRSGWSVVPKRLRDRLGLTQGEVEVEADGASLRVHPVAEDTLAEQDGWLVVPATGVRVTDDDVRELRDADQR